MWQVALRRLGKKAAFTIGLWVLMLALLSLLFIDFAGDNVVFVAYPLSVVGGAGVAAAYLLPW